MEDRQETPWILALETATGVGAVALARGDRIVLSARCAQSQSHSRWTAPTIATLLDQAGIAAGDLAAVAVSIGPGSFTGVRIGLSLAKGICLAGGPTLIPVSTLEALAWSAATTAGALILPLMDARRGEAYGAVFRAGSAPGGAPPERLCDDDRLAVGQWLARLDALAGETPEGRPPVVITGAGRTVFRDAIVAALGDGVGFAGPFQEEASAEPVALLAARRLADGTAGPPAEWIGLEPEYIRPHAS